MIAFPLSMQSLSSGSTLPPIKLSGTLLPMGISAVTLPIHSFLLIPIYPLISLGSGFGTSLALTASNTLFGLPHKIAFPLATISSCAISPPQPTVFGVRLPRKQPTMFYMIVVVPLMFGLVSKYLCPTILMTHILGFWLIQKLGAITIQVSLIILCSYSPFGTSGMTVTAVCSITIPTRMLRTSLY
ncbi:hypothetical protein RHGRI_003379 [Rhododendron griersonianum]|uniref:NADH dehydrogenase subunit 2 n=1 Tax=Rhododendron griersonianum TaxID=479676 RepID=A0AAV6L744_9ERIC|nr:hypothetical protein RHGRI_003379 [Rhododendron griersonianum]